MSTLIKVIMIFAVASLIGIAGAQYNPPNVKAVGLQGSISIGGNPAPQGTAIFAKVGNTVVGNTTVQTAGVYGDTVNNRLPVVATNDGTTIDFYVNGVKAIPNPSFTYYQKDTGQIFQVDLNVPGPQVTTPQVTTPQVTTPQVTTTGQQQGGGGGGDGGYGGGGTTPKKGTATPTVAATGAPKEALPGAEGTPMPSAVTPIPPEGVSNLPIILGATAVLAIGGIIILLKKLGKI